MGGVCGLWPPTAPNFAKAPKGRFNATIDTSGTMTRMKMGRGGLPVAEGGDVLGGAVLEPAVELELVFELLSSISGDGDPAGVGVVEGEHEFVFFAGAAWLL